MQLSRARDQARGGSVDNLPVEHQPQHLVTIWGSFCHDRRCPAWRGCSSRSVSVKTSVCVTGCFTPWMRAISVASRFTVALRFAMAITWCRRQRAMRVGLPVLFRQCRNSFVVDLDHPRANDSRSLAKRCRPNCSTALPRHLAGK